MVGGWIQRWVALRNRKRIYRKIIFATSSIKGILFQQALLVVQTKFGCILFIPYLIEIIDIILYHCV